MFVEKFKQCGDLAREFSIKRKEYFQKYDDNLKQLKTEIVTDECSDDNPLSIDELRNLGENAAEEYLAVKNIGKQSWLKQEISYDLFNFDVWDHMEDKIVDDNNDKKIVDYGFDKFYPEQNYQKTYFLCIEKIKSFGIDIYGVKKMPEGYLNMSTSTCGGGGETFEFYCGKNHYRFILEFVDDCDCMPGMLLVKDLTDLSDGTKIMAHCDLFCQNTDKSALKSFLMLLESDNMDDFTAKRYGHYFELPLLLESSGLNVSYTGNLSLNNNNIILNDNDCEFTITVETNKGMLSMSPMKDWGKEDYVLIIHQTLDQINEYEKDFKWEKINGIIIGAKHVLSWEFPYHSNKNFPELLQCVSKYLDCKNGNYGYFDGEYLNEKFIRNYFSELKGTYINLKEYGYGRPEIDFDIKIANANRNDYRSMNKDRIKSEQFWCDIYKIALVYDNDKSNKCHVVIQGYLYDSVKLANDYYKNKNVAGFDFDKYKLDIFNIFDDIKFSGSLTECCQLIKEFLIAVYNKDIERETEKMKFVVR